MSALICGSFAYDNIMVFKDRFKNHILPDKVHMLSVSFLVPELRREYGGCAGNIAYNLRLLGAEPLPMGTVGKDFDRYAEWMDERRINRRHVLVIEEEFTAQAFITTDLDDNQITAFHPGAMNHSHRNTAGQVDGVRVAIVAPDGRQGMIDHAAQLAEAGIPFVFDPGQGLPMFDGGDLKRFIAQATWLTLNDYECELLLERTGYTLTDLASRVKALIVTRGAAGSEIHVAGRQIKIPTARVGEALDPTGCGDAYRAGLLYGLLEGMDWELTGRLASLMGALKVECHGTQNHRIERSELEARFQDNFGTSLA